MVKITKAVVTDGDVTIHTSDGKVITLVVHPERLYVGVSGAGSDLMLVPSQYSANSVNIRYDREPDPPITLAIPADKTTVKKANSKRR